MKDLTTEEQRDVMVVDSLENQVHLENGKVEITLAPKERQNRCWTETVRKIVYGLMLVTGIAVSWVSATQFSKSTYSATFSAPFFIIWHSTLYTIVCYPVYIMGSFVLFKQKRKDGLRSLFREDQVIYGEKGLTVLTFFKFMGPFCFCYITTNYMYIRALGSINVTDVTALFATNTAFIYILSWFWLTEKFILIPAKSFSVLMSILGTILICYDDGFGIGRTEGILLALGASFGAAVYKVLFFKIIGKASYGQVSLFLTMIGLFNAVFSWPIMLVLYLTGAETVDWGNLPTLFLCGGAVLSLIFNFLVNFGIAITFPLFIALGTVIGIPMNAVVDWLFRDATFGWLKIIGGLLIITGFLVMLVPEAIQRKAACWKEGDCPCERRRQKLDNNGSGGGAPEPGEEDEGAGPQEGDKWIKLEPSGNGQEP